MPSKVHRRKTGFGKLLTRLMPWRFRSQSGLVPFEPRYSDELFFSALQTSGAANRSPELSAALQRVSCGDAAAARRLVVQHFDSRREPAFFVDFSEAQRLLQSLNTITGNYIERVTSAAHEMTAIIYKAYGVPIAPLRPGFPWGGRRNEAVEDILFAAQPHRFTFAPILSLAGMAGSYSSRAFLELLKDWSDSVSSDASGIGFVSSLVAIQRLIACSWAYALLGEREGSETGSLIELKWHLLKIIRQDVAFLVPRLGDAYPNNHLLIDRFAAWYIAACYPEFAADTHRMQDAEEAWLKELDNQTYPDGGYFEPSVHYHMLATEAAAGYYLLSGKQGRTVPRWFRARLERMLSFQANLAGADGYAPGVGDAIEDPLFPLAGGSTPASAASILYRTFFDYENAVPTGDLESFSWAYWMSAGRARLGDNEQERRAFAAYPDAGVFVIRDTEPLMRCIFRTGPSRAMRVMPGHMHSDLLSICLVNSSIPLILDAGTYSYRYGEVAHSDRQVNWRAYFTGVAAHNTLQIDRHDPLEPLVGDFRTPGARIPTVESLTYGSSRQLAFVEGKLCGAGRYVGVTRGVVFVYGEYLVIWNILPKPVAGLSARFLFQLAPGTVVHEIPSGLRFKKDQAAAILNYSTGLRPEKTLTGSLDPLAGWVSPVYGQLLPAPQLRFGVEDGSTATGFCIRQNARPAVVHLECQLSPEGARVIRVAGEHFQDLILVNSGDDPSTEISLDDIRFSGRVLWLREHESGQCTVSAHKCRELQIDTYGVKISFPGEEDFMQTAKHG